MVKNLPASAGDVVRSMGQEDPLEKEMVTHSRILAWKIQWTEEPGKLQSKGSQKGQIRLSDYTTTQQHNNKIKCIRIIYALLVV